MVHIALFGGTGPTGLEVIKQALSRGYSVTALVRNVEKLQKLSHENLHVMEANVFDPDSLHQHLADKDAVVSCLGYTEKAFPRQPISFYTDSMRSITSAMSQAGVRRLICMTTWCTKDDSKNPFIIEWIFKPLLLKYVAKNMAEMEGMLQETTDVTYTVVKPAQLTNDNDKEDPVKTVIGEFVPYTFWEACTGKGFTIPRAKVARFMLDCLDTTDYDNKLVSVA